MHKQNQEPKVKGGNMKTLTRIAIIVVFVLTTVSLLAGTPPKKKIVNPLAGIEAKINKIQDQITKEANKERVNDKKIDKLNEKLEKTKEKREKLYHKKKKPLEKQADKIADKIEKLAGEGKPTEELEQQEEKVRWQIECLDLWFEGEDPNLVMEKRQKEAEDEEKKMDETTEKSKDMLKKVL